MKHRHATFATSLALLLACLLLPGLARAAAEVPCSEVSELDCLESTRCTLVKAEGPGKYTCREDVGTCESGMRQRGDGDIQKKCESRPGCEFKRADCYCPPNLQCYCGGGPPAQCVERSGGG